MATEHWKAIRTALAERFADECEIPIEYPNQPAFQKPDADDAEPLWGRLSIQDSDRNRVDFGGAKSRRRASGAMVVQLFYPQEKGTKDVDAAAKTLALLFQSVTISGVVFRTPNVRTIGRTGEWWQVNVECPFYADTFS